MISEGCLAVQRMKEMGIDDALINKHSSKLDEIAGLRRPGSYLSFRNAAVLAYEEMQESLKDWIRYLDEAAKAVHAEILGERSTINAEVREIERRLATSREKQAQGPKSRGLGFFVVAALLGGPAILGFLFHPFGEPSVPAAILLVFIGALLACAGIIAIRKRAGEMESRIAWMEAEVDRAKARSPDRPERQLAKIRQHRETLLSIQKELSNHRPT